MIHSPNKKTPCFHNVFLFIIFYPIALTFLYKKKRCYDFIASYLNYSIISEIFPEPTVLPPSRIENLVPFSIAIG